MKKRIIQMIAVLMGVIVVFGNGAMVFAAQPVPIEPMYVGLIKIRPAVTISSGTVFCSDLVTVKDGYSANVTWTLQGGPEGKFNPITTWTSFGGTRHPLDTNRSANRGYSYRLKTSVKVYDSSGKLVDDETKYSSVGTY